MADSRTLNLILELKDKASKELNSAFGDWEKGAKKVGVAMTAVGGAITGAVALSVKAFQEQEKAEARLEQIARQVTGANQDQIQSFKDLAGEMQKVGVVGDEVVIAGQSQLASFTKSSEVVAELSDDLADLAVAQYGVNVSQDQAIQTGNLLGKALQGQLGALTRTGILVNDEFKAAFEAANSEQERAVIISQIVQDNYGGLNAAMRETSAGGMAALKNDFGDLTEQIGAAVVPAVQSLVSAVQPIIQKMIAWAEENPKVFNTIVKVTAAIGAIMLVLGPLLIILPAIVSGVQALIVVMGILLGPVGLVIAAIAALIAIGWLVISNWDEIKAFAIETWTMLGEFFGNFIDKMYVKIKEAGAAIRAAFSAVTESVAGFFTGMWTGIKEGITSGINWVIEKLNGFIRKANKAISSLNEVPGVNFPSISEIPKLAKGGIVSKPTIAMIGEAGPEAVVPLSKMNQMGGGGGVTVIVNGDVTGREIVNKVKQGIMNDMRLNQVLAL